MLEWVLRSFAAACRRVSVLFAVLLAAAVPGLASDGDTCTGRSLLPELARSHPELISEVRARAARIANTEAILWKVTRPGTAPSHLFGTMHVSDKRITAMSSPARSALAAAETVALEIEGLGPMSMLVAVQKMPELMVYTDGSRLDAKLSSSEFAKVQELLAKSGVSGQMAAMIRPWLVGMMLGISECERMRVAKGGKALDSQIEAFARVNDKPVIGLETIKNQLQAMAAIPDAEQVALLRMSLAFADRRNDSFETLIEAYLNRELGLVLELSSAMAKIAGIEIGKGLETFKRELIDKRNRTMFDASLPLVERGGAFIAVGAAHLIGKTGLVALYREAGFTVTAVD